MLNVKNTILDTILALVAPHLCSGCGVIGTTFCDNCKYNIIVEPFQNCILCDKVAISGVCDDHKAPFNQAWCVGERRGALQRLIGGYKFQNMKSTSVDLVDLLYRRLPSFSKNVIYVPVPTTPAHIRERGYDHMLLIAKQLARRQKITVNPLLRRKNMLTQHHANKIERSKQAETAFQLDGKVDRTKIYVVIDDILTTGASVLHASKLLKEAGATVWVVIIARQPLD